ncbi:YqzE family protein [Tepidibacillus fermentans]|uniref:YqzE-like protein n=1 Tax=Tepidibacillus fermentans TaxID=1281767 RepID=A0A4R3KJP4_9BACI|nr:YqzE family protein [Tepidibacillus fermentans]TCS83991.1 YqzE-like protein [Tepidibacillus fermentans]
MKSNDFVKYLTVQLMERMDQPQKIRSAEKKHKESFSHHWFGLIPLSLKMWAKRFQKNV